MTNKFKIRIPTPAEDEAIIRAALSDPDNPPLTPEQLAQMIPARDVPERVARMKRLAAGGFREIPSADTAAIDHDLAEHFRREGGDWEARLNDTLRKAVGL